MLFEDLNVKDKLYLFTNGFPLDSDVSRISTSMTTDLFTVNAQLHAAVINFLFQTSKFKIKKWRINFD